MTANRATFQPGLSPGRPHPVHHRDGSVPDAPHRLRGLRTRRVAADGTEREPGAGDAFDIPPGHDMWTIGDEPFVADYFDQPDGQ
jgi:hypothetical protein